MNDNNELATCIETVVIGVVYIVGLTIYSGWVLSIMWSWFAVPVFGVPPLSIAEAIGITFLARVMIGGRHIKTDEKVGVHASFFIGLTTVTLILGLGYLVQLFI